jgi:hypothetical protein
MLKEKNPNEREASNDYLWDASGTPDPEIQRLESLLTEFRHDGRPLTPKHEGLVLPGTSPTNLEDGLPFLRFVRRGFTVNREGRVRWVPLRMATAAIVILALSAAAYFTFKLTRTPGSQIAWDVSALSGDPQIGSQTIARENSAAKLRVGQTLTTNSTSRASVWQNDLGEIQVEPNSRVRLVQSVADHKRIQLELGTIHAAIWAPPTQFVVDTPSATAVDLGCAYTLQVNADGSGTLRTTLGWVGFHLNGRDSFIPAGAMCLTRPGPGPGTPYFEDASPQFRDALHAFDTADPSSYAHAQQLAIILAEARAKDALTLWHLLSRTAGPERAEVYDRLAALVLPPNGVTRDGILALNRSMLDRYWDALGLGRISVWRMWEQSTAPTSSSSIASPSS